MPARVWPNGSSLKHRKHNGEPSETSLVHACMIFLKQHGCLVWRMNVGAARYGRHFVRFGVPGMSDILAILPGGRTLFVECKRHPNVLTWQQERFIEDVREAGALAWVVYSVDELEDLWRQAMERRTP